MVIRGGPLAPTLAALLAERDPLRGAGLDLATRLAALQGKRTTAEVHAPSLARIRQEAKRLARGQDHSGPNELGVLAALAYPDRVGLRRKGEAPRYASGRPNVTLSGQDTLTRHYTRFWETIPFMTQGVPGFGVFAMNRAGRARWGAWPDIISDDTFARLSFAPSERVSVPATYDWPMIEGFSLDDEFNQRATVRH